MTVCKDTYIGCPDLQQKAHISGKRCTLPLELYEDVIDYLWDDLSALLACSLTCRALTPRTRFHIFRVVTLGSLKDCIDLKDLLDFSARASGDIAFYIRDLQLGGRGTLDGSGRFQTLLRVVLPRLKYVESLRISGMQFNSTFIPVQDILTFSSEIRSLCLHRLLFYSPADALRLISAFPKLSAFRADTIWMSPVDITGSHEANPKSPHDSIIKIGQFTFLHGSSDVPSETSSWLGFPRMLLEAPFDFRVRDLHWKLDANPENSAVLAQLLQQAGPSLRRLRIQLNLHPAAALTAVDLCRNTHLSSITIDSIALAYEKGIYDSLPDLLSSATSTAMRTITLNLACLLADDTEILDCVPWERLDKAFASLSRLSSQLCVAVAITCRATASEARLHAIVSKVLVCLRETQARGVALDISCICEQEDEAGDWAGKSCVRWSKDTGHSQRAAGLVRSTAA